MTTTTTRRAMLAIGAALPALVTSQALARSSSWGAAPDPIFAAIEAHRAAVKVADARYEEHDPVYEKHVGGHLNGKQELTPAEHQAINTGIYHPEFVATSDAWNAACETAQEAARVLAFTEPTTVAGLAEAMVYLADHMAALGDAPEDDTFLEDDGLFSAVFAFTLSEAAQMLATA